MDPRVRQTIATMEEQLHRRVNTADLARATGLSVSHLTRLFRAATGRAPSAFLHDLRMARARILVEHTSLTIAEVMAQVGISDRSHFARDFRRAYGITPRMLRVQTLRSAHRSALPRHS